ncbi:hypothetical protein [Paenibacillus sp. FSL H7-0331]|uniref:hypothetical protein n=1 Tax=Paenibacillus sp. FSL H7-0331 TaxID=1920421 RepID=UPI0015C30029|nr:hypothetical protein [Paenibacillus sp. FSL H7-0331]
MALFRTVLRDSELAGLVLSCITRFDQLSTAQGEIEMVYKQHVRPESKKLFADVKTNVLPVMQDLYRHHDIGEWHHEGRRKLLYYTVNVSALKPYDALTRKD